MRKFRTNWKKKATEFLELPTDTLLDLPRVTLIGGLQLHVENFKGILEFGNEQLRLALTQGHMVVFGQQLIIKQILTKEIFIEGDIHGIRYYKE